MSEDKDARLIEVAGAVADGDPVDWEASAPDPQDSGAFERLHVLESVAAAYRVAREAAAAEERLGPAEGPEVTQPVVLFTWGHLQVLQKLGEGSFGEVYRAFDPVLERDVALKLRRAEQPEGIVGRRAILDEARRLARVRHPNVLTVHGADVHDGRVGLWTDLISGQTLEERLRQDGPLGAHEAALAGIELCDALAAVHAQGLTHGDVKAANIMRERGGRVVLMDFGAVTEVPRCGSGGGATLGTPLVMAPEVLRGETPGTTADLYSLGVLLYRLVSGHYPVEAESVQELCEQHARGESVPLADRRPDLPTAFLDVVDRALGASPEVRFSSAGAMRKALSGSLGQTPRGASDPTVLSGPGAGETEAPRHRRSRKVLLALAAGLVLTVPLAMLLKHRMAQQTASTTIGVEGGLQIEAGLYREASGQAEAVVSGGGVTPGDRLFLEVESGEPVHVYVLNEDDKGNRYVLFPLAGLDSSNPLPGRGAPPPSRAALRGAPGMGGVERRGQRGVSGGGGSHRPARPRAGARVLRGGGSNPASGAWRAGDRGRRPTGHRRPRHIVGWPDRRSPVSRPAGGPSRGAAAGRRECLGAAARALEPGRVMHHMTPARGPDTRLAGLSFLLVLLVAPALRGQVPPACQLLGGDCALIHRALAGNRLAEVATLAERALAAAETSSTDPLAAVQAIDVLVSVRCTLGRGREPQTVELAERAVAIRTREQGESHPDLIESLHNLAQVLRQTGEFKRAWKFTEQALGIAEARFGPDHAVTVHCVNELAAVQTASGDAASGTVSAQRALGLAEKVRPEDRLLVAESLNALATARFQRGDAAGTVALFRRALDLREAVLDPDHPLLARAAGNLGIALTGDRRSTRRPRSCCVARWPSSGAWRPTIPTSSAASTVWL